MILKKENDMCYGGPGQMEAAAAGIPPSVARSGTEPGPDPDSAVDTAQASQNAPKLDTPGNI